MLDERKHIIATYRRHAIPSANERPRRRSWFGKLADSWDRWLECRNTGGHWEVTFLGMALIIALALIGYRAIVWGGVLLIIALYVARFVAKGK